MMDEQSQKLFDQIIAKNAYELSEIEQGILRARRDYLSDQDRKKFADVLEVKKVVVDSKPSAGPDLKRPALMKEAKKLGIKFEKDVTTPQLRAMIDNAKFEAEALEEDAQLKAEERKELEEQAKALKIGFGSDTTNEELVEKIKEAQAATQDQE